MESNRLKIEKATHFTNQIGSHFDARAKRFGAKVEAVDWKSTVAQHNRFEQILKVVDFSQYFSINDFGCGYGELFDYLNNRNFDFDYFGFDVSISMLEKAREKFVESKNCSFSSDYNDLQIRDYTVASGIFNLKFDADDDDWRDFMMEEVLKIAALSSKGFSFNALTSYSDLEFRRADLYYADALFWFDFCKRNVSRYVSLLHDYPEYDFTIIVRK